MVRLSLIMIDILTIRNEMNFVCYIDGFVCLWNLCINIDADTGFQFNRDTVIPDGDLLDSASHQRFVKFGEVGSLLRNIILQVIDSFYLCISGGGINCVLPTLFTKLENLLCDFTISFLVVCLLQKFFLQSHQLLIYFFGSAFVCVTNHLCYILLQLCLIGRFVAKQPVYSFKHYTF